MHFPLNSPQHAYFCWWLRTVPSLRQPDFTARRRGNSPCKYHVPLLAPSPTRHHSPVRTDLALVFPTQCFVIQYFPPTWHTDTPAQEKWYLLFGGQVQLTQCTSDSWSNWILPTLWGGYSYSHLEDGENKAQRGSVLWSFSWEVVNVESRPEDLVAAKARDRPLTPCGLY